MMTNLVLFNWTIIYLYIWGYCLWWLAEDKIGGIFYTDRKNKIKYVVLMEVVLLVCTISMQSWLMNKQYEVGTYLSARWGSLLRLFVGLETSIFPPWQIGYTFFIMATSEKLRFREQRCVECSRFQRRPEYCFKKKQRVLSFFSVVLFHFIFAFQSLLNFCFFISVPNIVTLHLSFFVFLKIVLMYLGHPSLSNNILLAILTDNAFMGAKRIWGRQKEKREQAMNKSTFSAATKMHCMEWGGIVVLISWS